MKDATLSKSGKKISQVHSTLGLLADDIVSTVQKPDCNWWFSWLSPSSKPLGNLRIHASRQLTRCQSLDDIVRHIIYVADNYNSLSPSTSNSDIQLASLIHIFQRQPLLTTTSSSPMTTKHVSGGSLSGCIRIPRRT